MPSYFFHLAFELFLFPPTNSEDQATAEPQELYLPPPGTDIFTSTLPVHRVSAWTSSQTSRRSHKRSKTTSSHSASTQNWPALTRRARNDTGLPAPSELQKTAASFPLTSTGSTIPEGGVSRDWRFGEVVIQSIDMELRDVEGASNPRGRSATVAAGSSGLATKGRYVPSNPKNTEVGWGVVHLYRDAQETPGLYDDPGSSASSESGRESDGAEPRAFDDEDCTTLCILAVPSYMTPSDLLGYVGEQTREDVSHFRLIRTGRTNRYMVLMKFREAKKAKLWRKEWNGKPFNSMEEENCHVVFVRSIQFQTSEADRGPSSFPTMTDDPFTPAAQPKPAAAHVADSTSRATPLTTKPLAPPTPALVELPTCPVCLERMDETTGLLTILCQHVFHCACLEKWRGSGCPVCRYTQNDSIARAHHSSADLPENECSVCGTTANLWICLICGNTGCGRYDSAHAFAHYDATAHSYAMDIATQHVWDYAGDGYVHRLIQSKADGKLVDLPAAYSITPNKNENAGMTGFGADTVPREKLDNMGVEYAYLLTSQLDSQRLYFEEQVERAVDKAAQASAAAEKAAASATVLAAQLAALHNSNEEARTAVAALEKDVERANRRAEKAEDLARKMGREWREEKSVSGALMQKIGFLDGRVRELESRGAELEAEKRELEEQNRDLSFFISGTERLKEMGEGEEVVEGRIEVPVVQEGKRKKGKGKGKGKK